jgi:hypothetical protein
VIFVEDEEQLDKVLEVRERLPRLQWIVVFDMEGLGEFKDAQVIGLDALRERGRAHDQANPGEFERARPAARRTTWRSWSTPRAPPAGPRARCTCTAR